MSKTTTTAQDAAPTPIPDDIGILRRFLRGRKWYGTEWYITVVGGGVLLLIVIVTLLASVLAPFDPNEFAGAQFTPPGGGPQALLARAGQNPGISSADLKASGIPVGVWRGTNGVNVAKALSAESERYQLQSEQFEALRSGEVDLILVDQNKLGEILAANPDFEVVEQKIGNVYRLGTDNLGRDITSRLIWGARTVLTVAFLSALLSSSIGVFVGLLSGYIGGPLDRVLSLVMDSIYSFPGLLLAIALVAMLGPGILNVAVAMSVVYIPTFFRVVRGQVLSIKEELYVEAARSLGASSLSILTLYIFPNVIPSVVVVFSLNVADAILTEAGLSFIGLGLPPEIPDWGFDVSKGQQFLVAGRWWMITFPGIMIALVAAGFSLLGEGLSEILNPRLTER
jgi:peptide/nickel transport system permease protein